MDIKCIIEIGLEQAEPGKILAKDVLDANNDCRIASGSTLTEENLILLKQLEIKSIEIEAEPDLDQGQDQGAEEDNLAQREACIAQLEHRFRQVQDIPHMQRLKELLLEHKLKGLL